MPDLRSELASLACEWNQQAAALEARGRMRLAGGRLDPMVSLTLQSEARALRQAANDLESVLAICRRIPNAAT